jgi:hypothetical protein
MIQIKRLSISVIAILSLNSVASATEIQQQFKDPSFNNNGGWTTQVLTVYQAEQSAKQALENQAAARAAAAAAAAQNTPLAKFMSLFSSQVYAQLATQLSNNLFQNNCKGTDGAPISGCSGPVTGNFSLDGSTVTWLKTATDVQLTVVDAAGNKTYVSVPIAQFAF